MRPQSRDLLALCVGLLVATASASCTDELARTTAEQPSTAPLNAATEAGTPSSAVVAAPTLDPTFDPAREAAIKRSMRTGAQPADHVDTTPDAEAVALWPTLPAEVLDPEARRTLATTDVPVLLPAPALLGSVDDAYAHTTATVGPGWYALSVHTPEGLTVLLQGSRRAHLRPELAAGVDLEALQVDGGYLVSRTHGIVTVSWRAFGEVAYSLDVECPVMPLEDPRCAEDAFALSLADSVLRAELGEGQ